MTTQFRELDARYRRLEESLDRLNAKLPQVTIENVHIHQPVLEKLEFRLDGLDIEHLSGSLNLGNNFGAKIGRERQPEDQGQGGSPAASSPAAPSASSVASSALSGLDRTPTGFRFSNRR